MDRTSVSYVKDTIYNAKGWIAGEKIHVNC